MKVGDLVRYSHSSLDGGVYGYAIVLEVYCDFAGEPREVKVEWVSPAPRNSISRTHESCRGLEVVS